MVAAVALPMPRATLRPSAQGARAAQSVPELVAWRGRMASLVESLPEKEQREWDRVFDGEMKVGDRLEEVLGKVELRAQTWLRAFSEPPGLVSDASEP